MKRLTISLPFNPLSSSYIKNDSLEFFIDELEFTYEKDMPPILKISFAIVDEAELKDLKSWFDATVFAPHQLAKNHYKETLLIDVISELKI